MIQVCLADVSTRRIADILPSRADEPADLKTRDREFIEPALNRERVQAALETAGVPEVVAGLLREAGA